MTGIRVTCLWPGLAGAWQRGILPNLLLALLCTWAACFLLLATFVWPEWIGVALIRILWVIACFGWLGASIKSHLHRSSRLASSTSEQTEAFQAAQREYLRGNWFEAEAVLLDLVHRNPGDAEGLLLLASVLRQTRRWQPALRRLGQLELLDAAAAWGFEIGREKAFIEKEMARELESEKPAQAPETEPASESVAESV